MATVRIPLLPEEAQFLSTLGAQYDKIIAAASPTNPVPVLKFDGGSADTFGYWHFTADAYGSGNITATIFWIADAATSGNVVWGARLAATTQNTDTESLDVAAFAAAQTVQDAHLGTTARRLHSIDLTISNLDSLAAGDRCILEIYRDASDTVNDTMAGFAMLTEIVLAYSDT